MFKKLSLFFFIFLLSACQQSSSVPKLGSILRMNIFTEPPTLDSRRAIDTTSMNVINMIFEGLTRLGENERPYPALADKITISENKRIYHFHLREAYWSNGDPITAEDFVYAWQKILDPLFPSPLANKLYPIKNARKVKEGKVPVSQLGAKALDEKTIEVHLNYPAPYFLELTAFPTYFPINKKIDEANAEWASEAGTRFVGNGPFILKSWDHESQITLEKNPFYWDASNVKLDEIFLVIINDLTTEFYMFEMNELDWAGFPLSSLAPDILPQLIKEGKAQNYQATATYYYKFNTDLFPFNNINIRRAFALAVNREAIVEHVTQAKQIPALSLVPPIRGWPTPYSLFNDNDQELARVYFRKGLEELEIEEKDFPKVTLIYNSSREHQKIAQAIQQQWVEVLGVKVELDHFDWKVYLSKVNRQDYQIARMGWVGDFKDPITFLTPFKYRDDPRYGGHNETGWEHPEYIFLLDQANEEQHEKKRIELLKKAETLLISEMPIIPIFFVNCWYLKKTYVYDVLITSLGIADFKKAYILK